MGTKPQTEHTDRMILATLQILANGRTLEYMGETNR